MDRRGLLRAPSAILVKQWWQEGLAIEGQDCLL